MFVIISQYPASFSGLGITFTIPVYLIFLKFLILKAYISVYMGFFSRLTDKKQIINFDISLD